jgi:hypothetical protein
MRGQALIAVRSASVPFGCGNTQWGKARRQICATIVLLFLQPSGISG